MAKENQDKKEKTRIFIGSSLEGLHIANNIQLLLEHIAEPTVWTQGVFEATSNALDDLIDLLDRMDFGIFVFSPDDISKIRKQKFLVARDNVIFEMGLFIGRLGKRRTFYIIPRNREKFHLPSDLIGVTALDYDNNRSDGNIQAALGSPCTRVIERMNQLGRFEDKIVENKQTIKLPASMFTPQEESEFQYIFTKLNEPRIGFCNIIEQVIIEDKTNTIVTGKCKFNFSFLKALDINIQNGNRHYGFGFLNILENNFKSMEPVASIVREGKEFVRFVDENDLTPKLKQLGLLNIEQHKSTLPGVFGNMYSHVFSDKMYRFVSWLDYHNKIHNEPLIESVEFVNEPE